MTGKIFGLGLSKTGTTSLHHAFKELGFVSKHFPKVPELFTGQFRCLDKYDAACDVSIVPYYPQLDAAYPDSKFILTVRNVDDWLRSMESWWRAERKPSEYMIQVRLAVYGVHTFHPGRLKYVYERHTADVEQYFAERPGDLLKLNICAGEGWEKLCPFLGKPVRGTNFPFVVPGSRPKKRAMLGLFKAQRRD